MSTAIIGVDGLDPVDVATFDMSGEWDPIEIETVAHTVPSWNAIFTGRERDGVYTFEKIPAQRPPHRGALVGKHTTDFWDYEELRTDDYLWERTDVDVVSAPVVLPTFSTLEDPPGSDVTWCSTREEVTPSIDRLTELTLRAPDDVLTVYPQPDKIHHMVDNAEKDYTSDDRAGHMDVLDEAVVRLTEAFDQWVVLSDHGRPSSAEQVPGREWYVPGHRRPGVIRSNCIDTEDLTNVTVYDELLDILS